MDNEFFSLEVLYDSAKIEAGPPSHKWTTYADEIEHNNYIKPHYETVKSALKERKEYKELEERYHNIPIKILCDIVDNIQNMRIDENTVGYSWEHERWQKIKCFIPVAFNCASIICDTWDGENFTGNFEKLHIPLEQFNKSWWLVEEENNGR